MQIFFKKNCELCNAVLTKYPGKCYKVHQNINRGYGLQKCLIIFIVILPNSYSNKLHFIWLFKEREKANSETKDN